MMKSGILLLNKQAGMTSFDCVRQLKRSWGRTDLGHGGTLDKFATGVLPILVGEGLKLARFFLESHPSLPTYWKTYSGAFIFGRSTETGDPEGMVVERQEVPATALSADRVAEAMQSFIDGRYEQRPPRYSAKKIDGNRASDLVRQGTAVELAPVAVTIRAFTCTGIDGTRVSFRVECSKGTYVRALAEDLARRLGTVAHVAALSRDAVGDFTLSQTLPLESVVAGSTPGAFAGLLDMSIATSFLPSFAILAHEREQLRVGKVDGLTMRLANSNLSAGAYRALDNGVPVALLELTPDRRGVYLRGIRSYSGQD